MEEPREIGDWIVVSELGSGSFGIVKLWRNQITDDFIAVKKCRFSLPKQLSKRQRERWISEVKMMQAMQNENIVSFRKLPEILDVELSKYNVTKLPLLSMEYCSKGNLRKYLTQSENLKGLQEAEVRYVLGDMANAVSYLHGLNVTHRDIKPENIVLQETDGRPNKTVYKLIDLGYAKELETLVQSFVGTLQYVAPEIFKTENYNNKVDYWSLGIVAFEIITGTHPFLHHLSPAERFLHIEKKSPENICIRAGKNGTVKYYSQIVIENHVSQAFKTNMESWLRLMLQCDPNMRGVRNNTTRNVFDELESILMKKIIKVFSVTNYKYYSYEVTEAMTISDLKILIERDMDVPRADQFLLTEKLLLKYDDDMRIIDCFFDLNHDTTLYVFARGECIKQTLIELPDLIKVMFENGHKEMDRNTLKQLYAWSIHFISQEDKSLSALRKSCCLQMQRLEILFRDEEELFVAVRNGLSKLTVGIECHGEINQKFMEAIDASSEKFLENLMSFRRYLRQSKELVENVNALTARRSSLLRAQRVLKTKTEKLEEFFDKTTVKTLYQEALRLYEQLEPGRSTCQHMSKILSETVKIKNKLFFKSDVLREYVLLSWRSVEKLQKLFVWTKCLEKQTQTVSDCMYANVYEKFDLVRNTSTTTKDQLAQKIRLSFHDDESFATTQLIKENVLLRYQLQDLISEAEAYHKHAVRDFSATYRQLQTWNGLKYEEQKEEVHPSSLPNQY